MNKKTIITILLVLVTIAGQAQVPLESVKRHSRGDRHLGYSSRHTQVSVPATITLQTVVVSATTCASAATTTSMKSCKD